MTSTDKYWVPRISIVTVCRNSEATIERTFRSLLDQTWSNFEYVVIDGKSVDGTVRIIEKYLPIFREKNIPLSYLSEDDDGIYDAMNKGIALCHGDFIGILNSDDYYDVNALHHVEEAAINKPDVDIIYGFLRQVKKGKELVIHRYNYDYILSDLGSGVFSAAQHPACFVKRSVYETIGAYDTSFSIAADYDFLLRAKRKNMRFVPLDHIMTTFSLDGFSMQVSTCVLLEERYRAQYRNGLLTEGEYREKQRELRYLRYRQSGRRLLMRVSRMMGR
jgi:glycosyltransferase involved in cell wall biosynthesis